MASCAVFLLIPQLKGLSRAFVDTRVTKIGLVQQLRDLRGCGHLSKGLEFFFDHTTLVQPNSGQVCHTMGQKEGVRFTYVVKAVIRPSLSKVSLRTGVVPYSVGRRVVNLPCTGPAFEK